MCYSQGMALSFTVLGICAFSLTHYEFWYKNPRSGFEDKQKYWPRATIILFYTAMELLQTIQYSYADQCNTRMNFVLTIIAHILVCVQPALWNWYRIKKNKNTVPIFRAFFWAGIVFVVFYTASLLYGLYSPDAIFPLEEMNVSPITCTIQGPSHICWMLPYASFKGLEPNYFTYVLIWFFPTLYEDKAVVIKVIFWLSQIILVGLTTLSSHENNSVWCLWSIPLIILFSILQYSTGKKKIN
jgi:hypothetical protein